MAYKGGVPVNSGFYPRNDFPIAEAKDIYVSDTERLDTVIERLEGTIVENFDNITTANVTHGESKELLSNIIETYILAIDYNAIKFDTSEIVINGTGSGDSSDTSSPTNAVLGYAILGQMVLG